MKIENGEIYIGSKKVGSAVRDFKFGYHPAVVVTINGRHKWFELDENNLLAKIADYIREIMGGRGE